jgi:exonuclease SbcC
VQAELDAAVEAAAQGLQTSEQERQTLEAICVGLEAQLVVQRSHFASLGQLLAREEQALQQALDVAGLGDEQSLWQQLLPVDEVRLWSERRRLLERAGIEAARRRSDREASTESHLQLRPPLVSQTALEPMALAQERDRMAAAQQRLSDQLQQLLRRREELAIRLETQDRALAQRAELVRAEAEATRTFHLWDRLSRLIGGAGANRLRQFAQCLNLDELLGKANVHLARLAPRYTLRAARDKQGERRLAFNVLDAESAQQERPTTTLSGGETFLVSLALALALAEFSQVRMPIETLLIDEGFGTLDVDTVQTALRALQALQAQGTQVGLISHVEALRAMIPAQIAVRAAGGGRSTVEVCSGSSPPSDRVG